MSQPDSWWLITNYVSWPLNWSPSAQINGQQPPVPRDKPADLDDLRVSRNQFNEGPINYHSIVSASSDGTSQGSHNHEQGSSDIANHIGKPLSNPMMETSGIPNVVRPSYRTSRPPQVRHDVKYTVMPRRTYGTKLPYQEHARFSTPASTKTNGGQLNRQSQGPSVRHQQTTLVSNGGSGGRQAHKLNCISPSAADGCCDWMPLNDLQRVSFDTGEVVVRNSEDQPTYILTISGFIKQNQSSYFPLKNFRPHPFGSKIMFENLDDNTSEPLALDCFMPSSRATGMTSMYLMPSQKAYSSFKEEITILVECGYLELHIRGNGSYLSLERLSFYRDADHHHNMPQQQQQQPTEPYPRSNGNNNKQPTQKLPIRIKPPSSWNHPEHLVFSTYGTHNSPLLTIPLISRYKCLNRITLTGNNSVQLNLDRFDLQRLTVPSTKKSTIVADSSFSPTSMDSLPEKIDTTNNGGTTTDSDELVEKVPKSLSIHRAIRDTTILYKSPLVIGK